MFLHFWLGFTLPVTVTFSRIATSPIREPWHPGGVRSNEWPTRFRGIRFSHLPSGTSAFDPRLWRVPSRSSPVFMASITSSSWKQRWKSCVMQRCQIGGYPGKPGVAISNHFKIYTIGKTSTSHINQPLAECIWMFSPTGHPLSTQRTTSAPASCATRSTRHTLLAKRHQTLAIVVFIAVFPLLLTGFPTGSSRKVKFIGFKTHMKYEGRIFRDETTVTFLQCRTVPGISALL